MKFSSTLASALSFASLAIAAPASSASSGQTLAFPPASQQPKPKTIAEIAATPRPGNDQPASNMTVGDGFSVQAACRNTIFRRWGTMSSNDRTNYVNAFVCLMNRPRKGIWNGANNLYEEIVYVHNQMVNDIHGSDIFLPWHRYYMYLLRSLMSSECGFNGPYPWWKETNNVGNYGASDIFSPQWFGALPQANGNNGFCITNGAFANLQNPISRSCVARGERRDMSASSSISNEEYVNGIGSYPDFRANLEGLNHAYGHLAIGPTMSSQAQSPAELVPHFSPLSVPQHQNFLATSERSANIDSNNRPTFFLHHSYVDWTWKRWQNQQPWRWTSSK